MRLISVLTVVNLLLCERAWAELIGTMAPLTEHKHGVAVRRGKARPSHTHLPPCHAASVRLEEPALGGPQRGSDGHHEVLAVDRGRRQPPGRGGQRGAAAPARRLEERPRRPAPPDVRAPGAGPGSVAVRPRRLRPHARPGPAAGQRRARLPEPALPHRRGAQGERMREPRWRGGGGGRALSVI